MRTYSELFQAFTKLQDALKFHFHRESVQSNIVITANLYSHLQKKMKSVRNKLKTIDNDLDSVNRSIAEVKVLETNLSEISQIIDKHLKEVDVKLYSADLTGGYYKDLKKHQRQHLQLSRSGLLFIVTSFVIVVGCVYSFFSAILVHLEKIPSSAIFYWITFVLGTFLFFVCSWKIFKCP